MTTKPAPLLYFAYASNLNKKQMKERAPDSKAEGHCHAAELQARLCRLVAAVARRHGDYPRRPG